MSFVLINHCKRQRKAYSFICLNNEGNTDDQFIHRYCQVQLALPSDSFYVTCNGHIVSKEHVIQPDHIYNVVPRVLGGKGGFGSMLRAIGAQIEKTTSREACRDLSGRRMRDVNNEKQLREWVGKQAERENERETSRQERLERRRAMPNHKFDDPKYEEQKSQVAEQLEDALQTGLSRYSDAGPSHTATKRKADSGPSTSKKAKSTEWLGVEMDNLSSSDSDSDNDSGSDERPSASMKTNGVESPESGDMEHGDSSDLSTGSSTEQGKTKQDTGTIDESMGEKVRCSNPQLNENKKSLLELLPPPIKESQDNAATPEVKATERVQEPFDLEKSESLQDLISVGLETLKEELTSRGLKCGGSLEQRAERLWAVKGLKPEQYPKGLLAKPAKGKKK